MTEILQQILGNDWENALIIILNLIIIESLLSVDNAAVLATMVMDLPQHQRARALRYGILGAYFFRGLCLIFAAWLIQIWWLKPLGGLYLLYLCYDYFRRRATPQREDDALVKEEKWFYKISFGLIGQFWATVVAVEVMDLAFSLDNVFAAVAFTDNIWLICIGVFIGILAMRFVAQWFVQLLERFPFLETSAFLVIGILGLKLFASFPTHFNEGAWWAKMLDSEAADLLVSILTASFFFVPILTSRFFNWPKKSTHTAAPPSSSAVDAQATPTHVGHSNGESRVPEKEAMAANWQTETMSFSRSGPSPRPVVRTNIYVESRYAAPVFPVERQRVQ